jgi:hypothetical protein
MFAYRWTWIMKSGGGRMQEGLELCETELRSLKSDYAKMRFYTPNISPRVFVVELIVESEEARDKWFAEFNAMPGNAAFWEKWHTLAERMVSSERWNVTELGD